VLRPLLLWAWRWFFRNWKRNLQRVSTTTAVLTMARQLVNGKPETVFRGSLEPGAGIQVRVLDPGER
jgi:NurA-like 5'-3' nuclease